MQGRNKQIKSKQRVQQHGEVFTADREVNAMLDLVGPYIEEIATTVLEPACGEGAFLTSILERKLEVASCFSGSGYSMEWNALRVLSTLYGVDIQNDNVCICRKKMNAIVSDYIKQQNGHEPSSGFAKAAAVILKHNIVCGNTLTGTNLKGKDLKFSEWSFETDGIISLREYSYNEIIDAGGETKRNHRKQIFRWMEVKALPVTNTEVVIA